MIGLIVSKLFWISAHQTPLLSRSSIIHYGRKPYRTVGIEIKKNFEAIHAFSGKYNNMHTPSRKFSSITPLEMSCFSQSLAVADLAIAGKYEVISDCSFPDGGQRKTLCCKAPLKEQVALTNSISPEITCSCLFLVSNQSVQNLGH